MSLVLLINIFDPNPGDKCDRGKQISLKHLAQRTAVALSSSFSSTVTRLSAPRITFPAPQFKATAVIDGEFKTIALSDYVGKYVVLFFYPLDFTFVCPTEILAFSEAAKKFREIECEILACSCDSQFCHLAFTNTPKKEGGLGAVDIPLISDGTKIIARKYGVLKEDEGVAFRGLFIIDRQQRLRQKTINDLPVGRSVEETLRLVQAFQFTDIHGEVCPAGWRPGKDTIKPDAKAKKEYFEKQDKKTTETDPTENVS
ncbi:peroxiredoxin-1-like [Galendromus occidentalis]|uniref:thioredoxin-dependent peroxiredoxin n=1 Tax=Galendromus occidentalis TaxID=34638 RepID=A0AAJ7SIP6_9ACAR|nr:peroxiredoxin-1-like [Galendromus occidentalis]